MRLFSKIFNDKSTPEKPENSTPERNPLDTLADAISDVGYWRWWVAEFPDYFQVEFGGAQLYFPSANSDEAPHSTVAIRFIQPVSVSFLIRGEKRDFEWTKLLQEDMLEPPGCSYEEFTFTDATLIKSLLEHATEIKTIHGFDPSSNEFIKEPIHLIFWCGDTGIFIAAKGIEIVNYAGEIAIGEIQLYHDKWWEYWNTYWEKRDTDKALPRDFACEVCIPTSKYKYRGDR